MLYNAHSGDYANVQIQEQQSKCQIYNKNDIVTRIVISFDIP